MRCYKPLPTIAHSTGSLWIRRSNLGVEPNQQWAGWRLRTFAGSIGSNQEAFARRAAALAAAVVGDTLAGGVSGLATRGDLRCEAWCRGLRRGVASAAGESSALSPFTGVAPDARMLPGELLDRRGLQGSPPDMHGSAGEPLDGHAAGGKPPDERTLAGVPAIRSCDGTTSAGGHSVAAAAGAAAEVRRRRGCRPASALSSWAAFIRQDLCWPLMLNTAAAGRTAAAVLNRAELREDLLTLLIDMAACAAVTSLCSCWLGISETRRCLRWADVLRPTRS